MRNEAGLSYAAGASFQDGGVTVGGAYASSNEPAKVYRIIIDELGWLQDFDALGSAWTRFKNQYLLDYLGQNMTTDAQGAAIARAHLCFDDLAMADEYVEGYRGVTPRHVRRVADRYMRNLQMAFVGDTSRMTGSW